MAEYIERENAIESIKKHFPYRASSDFYDGQNDCINQLEALPAADVVKVVRCKDCKHCHELAPHCEFNRAAYFHCGLWRGDETKNVWHKYKKYYADYSIVEPNDFCSCGELKEREG